ncbi:MAG: xylose isomerase [Halanaerobiales bacterium]|nr:xylose isomerase [Halanaerobiales bacterium]
MYKPKYSVILANVGSCSDRFMGGGYSKPFTLEELFDRVASIEQVEGVELVGNWHITTKNVEEIKKNLERTNLKPISIIPDHFGQMKWGKGAFTSKDPAIRAEAVQHTKEMMDVAAEIGCDLISLWPGQDGYDYPFQGDYIEERGLFEEGVKECCKYRSDIRVAIEYKIKEPRNRSYPSNVGTTLLMVKEIDEPNCGVTIDYGHAEVAYENVAESVAILKKYGDKLFHVHMNDNYGFWDDDMITGSIHTIPYLEFFYWLKRTDYQGWISTDQYPYREDGREAVNESIQWFEAFVDIINKMDEAEVEGVIKSGDATKATRMIRKYLMGR